MQARQVISYILLGLSLLSIISGVIYMVIQNNQVDQLRGEFTEKLDREELPERKTSRSSGFSGRNLRGKAPFMSRGLSNVLIGLGVLFLLVGSVMLMTIKQVA